MRYKIGDRVKIKSLDWYNENKNIFGKVWVYDGQYQTAFDKDMSEWCGKIMTIDQIDDISGWYRMRNDSWNRYTDEMIEGLVEEESDITPKFGEISEDNNLPTEWNLPDGFEFRDENGNVIEAKKIVLEKKNPKYQKTLSECIVMMGYPIEVDLVYSCDYQRTKMPKDMWHRLRKMNNMYFLLICRDAYWKIAGEEMGLEDMWEPDWEDDHENKYIIYTMGNKVIRHVGGYIHAILAFPTEDMRDAFYENFKDLIEQCKELL